MKGRLLKPGFLVRATAVFVGTVVALSGCAGSKPVAAVSAADLQKGLVDRLSQTATPSTWVDCPKDLPGKVGASVHCDVTFNPANTVTAVLTTTAVKGSDISWEITEPELTKDQISQRVAGLMSAQSATCDSGLEGRQGAWVLCQVFRNGVEFPQLVEVKDVLGLALDLVLTPVIPRQQLEESVLNRLTANYGRRPDKAECAGDLSGSVGVAVKCVVTVGDKSDNFVATVTSVWGGHIEFQVATPTVAIKPGDIDMCRGCPG